MFEDDFCNAVGAQKIYACNHGALSDYPVYARILTMERSVAGLPETDAEAVPVTTQGLSRFQDIYNQKMKNIPAARYLTNQRTRSLLQEENCFFICESKDIIGIGIASDGVISAIASVRAGAGKDIVLALCKGMTAERVSLEVAEENTKALRLYERLGFSVTGVKNIWYKIK